MLTSQIADWVRNLVKTQPLPKNFPHLLKIPRIRITPNQEREKSSNDSPSPMIIVHIRIGLEFLTQTESHILVAQIYVTITTMNGTYTYYNQPHCQKPVRK